jgi:hypothetical protein
MIHDERTVGTYHIGRLLPALLASLAQVILARQGHAQRVDGDLSVGVGAEAWRAAATGQWHLQVGRLVLGAGLRFTYYAGDPAEYRNQGATTAPLPARTTIDPSVWGLNLMVSGDLTLVGRLDAGANIDLAGVAGGPRRRSGAVVLEPARGSLLLYGDNDRGSLNSEFYLGWRPSGRIRLRGGVSHYVTGYGASDGNIRTRYLRFDTVPFLAVGLGF